MKRILGLIICGVLVLGVTGCGSTEEAKENNDNSNNSVQGETNSNNDVVEKTYYCSQIDDDDWYYYFYYENDELTKIKVLAAKWSGLFEDYSEIKANAMAYDGVSLDKDSDFIYFDIDVKNGGYKYLNYAFSDLGALEENSSWSNANTIMTNSSYECVEK